MYRLIVICGLLMLTTTAFGPCSRDCYNWTKYGGYIFNDTNGTLTVQYCRRGTAARSLNLTPSRFDELHGMYSVDDFVAYDSIQGEKSGSAGGPTETSDCRSSTTTRVADLSVELSSADLVNHKICADEQVNPETFVIVDRSVNCDGNAPVEYNQSLNPCQ